jgi:hypothetical protein
MAGIDRSRHPPRCSFGVARRILQARLFDTELVWLRLVFLFAATWHSARRSHGRTLA